MKLIGFYGYSDVGKTTIVEKLCSTELNKYKAQKSKGITLKVGYADFMCSDNYRLYVLDNPGHSALTSETLRNVDLLDFAVYVFDATVVKDVQKLSYALSHYSTYSTLFTSYNVPYVVVLNKVDLCTIEQMEVLYPLIMSKSKKFKTAIPVCGINEDSIKRFNQKLMGLLSSVSQTQVKKRVDGVIARVIKSFDVNPEGVDLKQCFGGVLGVYFYTDVSNIGSGDYVINDRYPKRRNTIKIRNIRCQDVALKKIGSIETTTDSYFYKNDQKKSCFVIDPRYEFQSLNLFTIKNTLRTSTPVKGSEVQIICEGQTFVAKVKKVGKDHTTFINTDEYANPIRIPGATLVYMNVKNDRSKTLTLGGVGVLE